MIWVLLFWHPVGVCDNFTAAARLWLWLFLIPVCFNDTVHLQVLLKGYTIQQTQRGWEGPYVIYVSSALWLKLVKWRDVIWEAIFPKVGESSFWRKSCVTLVTAGLKLGAQNS